MYTDSPTDRSLLCICVSDGTLKILVSVLYMRMWKTPTHFGTEIMFYHREVVSCRSYTQCGITYGEMERWKSKNEFSAVISELWRWWACVHSLICSCISLWAFAESRALTGKNTCLHLHETHRIFILFFYWDQWRLMNNLVSFPTSPPGSHWRSTSQKLPIISSWLH